MQRECVGEHTGGGGYVHGVGIPESKALCLQVSLRSSFLKTIMDGSAVSLGGRQFHLWCRHDLVLCEYFIKGALLTLLIVGPLVSLLIGGSLHYFSSWIDSEQVSGHSRSHLPRCCLWPAGYYCRGLHLAGRQCMHPSSNRMVSTRT